MAYRSRRSSSRSVRRSYSNRSASRRRMPSRSRTRRYNSSKRGASRGTQHTMRIVVEQSPMQGAGLVSPGQMIDTSVPQKRQF